MKKQLIAIGLASVLTAPSVALADATVYGSFRTGLEFTSGTGASDATVKSFYSRFGLKGSSEVSEGLTASFQIERTFDSATATEPEAGRIGRVALAGGFGTLALGHMWTATGTHYYSKVTPLMQYGTTGGATGRASQMVSYASSVGAVSFQIDRYTDVDTKAATVEFGASADAGPVEVGFAYWSKEAAATTVIPTTVVEHDLYMKLDEDGAGDGTRMGTRTVETNKNGTLTTDTSEEEDIKDADGKTIQIKDADGEFIDAQKDSYTAAELAKGLIATKSDKNKATVKSRNIRLANPKTSFTGFYVSSSLAGMNLTVGLGSVDNGVKNVKQVADTLTGVVPTDIVDESQTDVSIVALKGSVGDSGVSYALWLSDSDKVFEVNALGETTTTVIDPSETVLHMTSALGGGASLVFEHSARKAGDRSLVALKVDF